MAIFSKNYFIDISSYVKELILVMGAFKMLYPLLSLLNWKYFVDDDIFKILILSKLRVKPI